MSQHAFDDDGISNPCVDTHLHTLVDRVTANAVTRRAVLRFGVGAAVLPFFGGLSGCSVPGTRTSAAAEPVFGFSAVPIATGDTVVVPPGYLAEAFLPWGEPLFPKAPAFKADASNTGADQEQQVGDNHDGMWFFGFDASGTGYGNRSDEGLLVFNHEYLNTEYFFPPGSDPAHWMEPIGADHVRKGQAGHGVTVAHIQRADNGTWSLVKSSPYNRRIHANTAMLLQGPAAGNDLVKTPFDPTGTTVLGTLNNCGSGWTPWGTFLTCEENFNGYFGWSGERTPSALETRYGVGKDRFGLRWYTHDPRFDLKVNPNEVNKFGYVVEIDPFDPASRPVKRTALGRFKHENAALVVAPSGHVVVYMGCDERNEYIYKFVSRGTFDAAHPTSRANRDLLENGTLYVAKFGAGAVPGDHMGDGQWIELTHGKNGLTVANGFRSQGDVLIRARQAADWVGATMMDRPEWVAANPKRVGEVYVSTTNNSRRGGTESNRRDGTTAAGSARPPVDEANPRANNVWGQIVRWTETGHDPTAVTFRWDIFVLAGQPGITGSRKPSANINADNLFNSPDGLAFDAHGRLWIQTDGNLANSGEFAAMGNNQMLVADPTTQQIKRFMVGPSGCEITGITWTPDRRTLFVNIQHPGEIGSNHPNAPKRPDGKVYNDNDIARDPTAFSQWPMRGMRPRSAVVIVRKQDGGVIGT
jgi:hypothetical protein